jgi:hypothetical protein
VASHYSQYDARTTEWCERVLVTLIGDLGPWRERLTLVGGLAPRYIVGELPLGVHHVGTNDVDVVLELFLEPNEWEAYKTLETNIRKAGFEPGESSFQWVRKVDGIEVILEFICETDAVPAGRIFKPKGQQAGNALGAVNIRAASLATRDAAVHSIKAERIGGGLSEVKLRVTNLLPFVVLKINAFQERHEGKDAYDFIFCLLHHRDGPTGAAKACKTSPARKEPATVAGLELVRSRFDSPEHDGPHGYAQFLADRDDEDAKARYRREAHAVVNEFLDELGAA